MARRSDHSREELIEMALSTAERFLGQQSIHDISARQIAKAMDYTVGTLYTLFSNLADLQLQVNGRTLAALHSSCLAMDSTEREPRERIQAYAHAYSEFAREQPFRWRAVFTRILPPDEQLPDWFQARVNAMFNMLEEPLRQLAPAKSEIQISEAARTLWGSVHGITALALDDQLFSQSRSVDAMTDELIFRFLDSWVQH